MENKDRTFIDDTTGERYDVHAGNDTTDNIYVLSYDEVINPAYGFADSEGRDPNRGTAKTDYASRGSYSSNYYWLRTPGAGGQNTAIHITPSGEAYIWGTNVDDDTMAVRPVLRLNLEKPGWTYGGTVDNKRQTRYEIKDEFVTLAEDVCEYDGTGKEPEVTVTNDGRELERDVHYNVSYDSNVNAGTATVTVTGKDQGIGTVRKDFAIVPADIKGSEITVTPESDTYTGEDIEAEVSVVWKGKTLQKDSDYTVSYENNRSTGDAKVTIEGKGNYTGKEERTFTIRPAEITEVSLPSEAFGYTGKAIKPAPVVKFGDSVLEEGSDYTLSYENNINAGKAKVTVTGTGYFTGEITKEFTIEPADIAGCNITTKPKSAVYTGSAIRPAPTVVLKGKTLREGEDYAVIYGNNVKPGEATMTIRGIDNYTGRTTVKFTITPRKVASIAQLTGLTKGFTVKWKKSTAANATGYQVRYSTKSSMAGAKIKTVKGYAKTSLKVTKLKAKKKYYVQVRTYKTVNGKKYCSAWSAKKTVTTK